MCSAPSKCSTLSFADFVLDATVSPALLQGYLRYIVVLLVSLLELKGLYVVKVRESAGHMTLDMGQDGAIVVWITLCILARKKKASTQE
jgi:hypothetical protein